MKFLVLGITGKRGSGKDTAAHYLRDKYGFRVLTYTDHVLAPILKKEGKPVTRKNLMNLALEMRGTKGRQILTELICRKIESRGFWAVSGVRYPEEHDYFRGKFGKNFKLVNVECEARKRYERVRKRGTKGEAGITFGKFMEIEKKETEKVINKTIKLADFSVKNNGTIGDLHGKVDILVKKIRLQ
ncbi:MAG: AAA family ATPase [Candidatus Aenigmatarchaeota archaeon]|nr:MAG: AAA family ATPase [Candidatus Aenigmarchaeota archaeon]